MERDVLVIGLFGGLVALDRRAFLQAMLSRPLVAGTGAGWLLADLSAGVYVGLVFELLYLGGAAFGGSHPDNDTLPAVCGTVFAATAARGESTPAMWALGVLLCAPLGLMGAWLETTLDVRARKYAGRATEAADIGDLQRAARQNVRAMWPHFVFYGLTCAVVTGLGHGLASLWPSAPPALLKGLTWAYPVLATVAAGSAVITCGARHALGLGAIAAAIVALLSAVRLAALELP